MAKTSYLIALGSNRRHGRHGPPGGVVRAAIDQLAALGSIDTVSTIRLTSAFGPAGRSFANGAVALTSAQPPSALLDHLQQIEHDFGRRAGRRWGPRVIDLDIILWSDGMFAGKRITIPHPQFRTRRFVLQPLVEIAPDWRDPISGLNIRQLWFRLTASPPVDRKGERF